MICGLVVIGCVLRVNLMLTGNALLRMSFVTPLRLASLNFSPLSWGEAFKGGKDQIRILS